MFVNTEQIKIGINNFIDNELGKKSSGFQKFAVYFAMPIIDKKIIQYLNNFSTNELTKEMFDENKNLDLNAVYNMAKSAVQKSGQFVFYGIMFNENDIDKLYTYIKGEN
jgi:hypothetical protein